MRLLILLLFLSQLAYGQITTTQQKVLNAYVDYANQSSKEIALVVGSLKSYYSNLNQEKRFSPPRYTCPVQPDNYYYENALALSKSLPSAIALNNSLKALRVEAEKIDAKCKELDTYHKLEDYKQDNYEKARAIINEFPVLVEGYLKRQIGLESALESAYKKTTEKNVRGSYSKADELMRSEVKRERTLLDTFRLNFQENIHSGFPVETLSASILSTDEQLKKLQSNKAELKYPASSMWTSFQESLSTVLQEKRRALDEYNNEAKKSDAHKNRVYLDLINYYNGTLVSNYNTFVQFSERDGYYGLKMIEYAPRFEIISSEQKREIVVKPFEEVAGKPIVLQTNASPISKSQFESLSNYVEFINETWRQVRYMQMVLTSFNSSASYYKTLTSYDKRAPMHFDYQQYQVPVSYYQKATTAGRALPTSVSESLNAQSSTLLNILKEMDAHASSIDSDVKSRSYERDHLDKIYKHLERLKALIEIWDEKKEKLYNDVRRINDHYPIANKNNSWQVSGTALKNLTDLDLDALFQAKAFYAGKSPASIKTEAIDSALRNVIAKEYENMKGIEKLGRYNGLCPYSPYEDLPKTSKILSERLRTLKSATNAQRHPYNDLVYLYNEIVSDHNKFAELSKDVPLLQTIFQPEIFELKYPEEASQKVQDKPVNVTENESRQPKRESTQHQAPVVTASTVIRDTVYIERRDTVYLHDSDENLRSMEGYATNNMVLLLDVSGSMNTPEKLPLLKESVLNMLSMMREQDEVSIVAFSGKASVLLKPVSFKQENRIRDAINNLKSSGKTDAAAGLRLAYKVADDNYKRGGNNRIILATDGEFPIGSETEKLIQGFATQDIYLSVFYFGKPTGATALQKLTNIGKGNFSAISRENVELRLIKEAKSKRKVD